MQKIKDQSKMLATEFWQNNCKNCREDKNSSGEQKDEISCDKLYNVIELGYTYEVICKTKIL